MDIFAIDVVNSNLEKDTNWWKRRTLLERKLSITSILLSITIVVITILALFDYKYNLMESYIRNRRTVFDTNVVEVNDGNNYYKYNYKNRNSWSDICLTPSCIEAAATILSHIDERVDPCDDFYRFSCGKWMDNSVIPDNMVTISTTGGIAETMDNQFRALVEQPSRPDDPIFFKNIKRMYTSCMDVHQLVRIGDSPLIELLNELGGWPAAEGALWKGSQFDWVDKSLKMREMGLPFNAFYHLSVGLDIKNNTKHIITIGEVSPGVGGRKVMLNGFSDPNVRAYYELVVESALLLGAKESNPNIFNEITNLMIFQIGIVNLTTPQEESRNLSKIYNKMTVRELQLMAPNTQWTKLLSGIFKQRIYLSDEVVVNNPNYVKQIDFLLKHTDNRLLANHMIVDVLLNVMELLDPKWLQLNDLYLHRLTGRKAVPPRWQTCIKSAASLNTAFSALYVRKYFKKESKQKVNEMVNYIHKEFVKMLHKVDWMEESTRTKALDKARTITSYIGFPEQLLNDKEIAKIYENLEEFSEHNYFQNALKLSKWTIDYAMKNLRQTRIKGNWRNFDSAHVMNAYYSAIENAIIFPAAILQGLFFNYQNPNYMNFGGIGAVISHEISHAFDDIGKQFDGNGNYKNWWDSRTDMRFKSKAQCLIEQYNNYVLPENRMKINGVNTLGENIADNAGVREAFRAYKAYVRQHDREKLLPGLKYSAEQLFWISYGNVWCTEVRPEVLKMIVDKDTHSPARYRVIGTLSNLKEFSESFNCAKGTPMNPIKKCSVW